MVIVPITPRPNKVDEEGRCGHNPGLVRIGGILKHEAPFDGNWQLCGFHSNDAWADSQVAG
jgi:hypothetical protein